MEEHGYLYHEYDYRLFMNENTSEFSEEAKQEVSFLLVLADLSTNELIVCLPSHSNCSTLSRKRLRRILKDGASSLVS